METTRSRSGSRAGLVEHYRALLEEQAQSELSVTEFAAEVGVSAGTLYAWRRRLADSAGASEVGDLVEVQGRLHYSKWTDREGVERYAVEIVAEEVLFL